MIVAAKSNKLAVFEIRLLLLILAELILQLGNFGFCFLNISIELFNFWIQIIPPIYRFTAVCRNVKSAPANSLY